MIRRSILLLFLLGAFACGAPPARALEAGTSILALQAVSGVADFVSPSGTYLSAYDHGELGIQGQYWYLTSDQLAIAFSGGFAAAREHNRGIAVADRFYQQRSWNARVGADRIVTLSDGAALYFGPGVEYWRGFARFIEILGPGLIETPTVERWSASGRFGAFLVFSESFSLTGHIGWRMGHASATEGAAESSWYTNGYEATAGLAYAF